MLVERWLPVVGFSDSYEVSDFGRVRSIDRTQVYERADQYSGRTIRVSRRHKGRLLQPGRMSSGHLSVVLGRRSGSRLVHVLVLEAFVGKCPPKHEGCHSDDNPGNNKLSNLRWGTRSDNLHDAVRNGRKPIGEQHQNSKLKSKDIPIIRERMKGPRGSIAALAREYKVNEATIRQVRDGISWRSA